MSEQRSNSSRLVYDPQSGLSIDLAELRRHSTGDRANDLQNDSRGSEESHGDS